MSDKSWTDDYVDFLASFTDAPPLYSRFMAWSLLGAVLSGNVSPISLAAEDLRPNFWTILIGPSGEARKSTELKMARRIARKADPSVTAPQGGSFVGVLEHLQKNPNILFVFDEFKRYMDWMSQDYNREAKAFFTEIYDWPYDEDWVATRAAGRGSYSGNDNNIRIKGPSVSMALGSTESWLTGAIGRSDMVSGFLVRYLLIPFAGKEKTFSYPPDRDKRWENRIVSTLSAAKKVHFRYHVLSEAREAYQEWYDKTLQLPTFQNSVILQPYFHRMTVYAWKICMVEAIAQVLLTPMGLADTWALEGGKAEKELKIDADLMNQATKWLTATLGPLAEMFEDSLAKGRFQEQRRDVIEAIKGVRVKHGFIKHTDLMRQVKLSSRDLKSVLGTLLEEERIISAKELTGKRGRVPVWYRALRQGEEWEERMAAAGRFWDKRKNDGQ